MQIACGAVGFVPPVRRYADGYTKSRPFVYRNQFGAGCGEMPPGLRRRRHCCENAAPTAGKHAPGLVNRLEMWYDMQKPGYAKCGTTWD